MTISGYSSAIVDTMLGWLKGLANWVLRLFNLAGSVSVSPLAWLSDNWLKLLIVFMIIGVAADLLVWLVRWRPHWVWFRKERVIVNDDSFFSEEDIKSESDWEEDLEKNWHERDYVVASPLAGRRVEARARRRSRPHREGPSTVVRRRKGAGERYPRLSKTSVRRGERRAWPGMSRAMRASEADDNRRRLIEERESQLFGMDGNRLDVTDFYEDEVFNVSNLPSAEDYSAADRDGNDARGDD